jgi:sugar phosphate permease
MDKRQYISKILGPDGMWKIFMPAVIAAILCMRNVIRFVEKGYSSLIIILSFAVTAAGLGFFFQKNSIYFLFIGCILFMIGYIVISTVIPSMANDIAENSYRGTANGIINSFQYIGSFAGPVAAGALWNSSQQLVIILLIIMALLGLYIMAADRKGKTR